jgi:hypothetical protein
MGALFTRTFTLPALHEVWSDLLGSGASDGVLSAGVLRFRSQAEARINALHDQLHAGTYQPLPLTVVEVPKNGPA